VSGQQYAPAALHPRERTSTHCTGDWVGPNAGLDERKISSPLGFDPGSSSPQSVAIPTELPGPPITVIIIIIIIINRNLKERDQSGDLDVNGRVISKWLLI